MCVCVWVCTWVQVSMEAKKDIISSRSGIIGSHVLFDMHVFYQSSTCSQPMGYLSNLSKLMFLIKW